MARWCIYGLTDPVTNEIKYIGKTDELQRRYKDHISKPTSTGRERGTPGMKNKWIKSLYKRGLLPGLVILEWTTASKAKDRERRLVEMYMVRGNKLANWIWARCNLPIDYQI